ncbi:hypothetical protein IW967_07365 [Alicyclobacillus mali]|uniref:Uncharacterized protein n=1 Tax=Alicyclobacillus mali (ex Roth et al. 2021) TaxID=1123961 RepID=A0ABS0F359_9BACL|nr:hypothetical protein [Alicyclobacillus mali (ex Roth et al. 2021)]MBF8377684.1 hypothetical protein [Alicyclobacillus mali (ex Roth et al. 2021)]
MLPALLLSFAISGVSPASPQATSGATREIVYGPTVHAVRLDTAHHVVTVDLRPVATPRASSAEATDGRGVTAPTSPDAYTDGRAITAPVSPHAYTDGRDTGRGAQADRGSLVLSVPLGWELDVEGAQALSCQMRTADLQRNAFQPMPDASNRLRRRFLLGQAGSYRLVTTRADDVTRVLDTVIVSPHLREPVIGAP